MQENTNLLSPNIKNKVTNKIFHSIGFKLISIVFSIYFLITFSVTIYHIYLNYNETKNQVYSDLVTFEKLFAEGIATSMWYDDREQLESLTNGMFEVDMISGIKIETPEKQLIIKKGIVKLNEQRRGLPDDDFKEESSREGFIQKSISYQNKVIYLEDNQKKEIGTITLYSNNQIVFQKVKNDIIYIVAGSVIKTLSLWIIFIIVSRLILSRPLNLLVDTTSHLDLENLPKSKLQIDSFGKNELTHLKITFNSMIGKLIKDKKIIVDMADELKSKNAELQDYSENLEKKVKKRTAEMKELFDNTGQGFLSFGSDLLINKEYSKACEVFFDKKIAGVDVLGLIFPNEIKVVGDFFNAIFSGEFSFDQVSQVLPQETIKDDYILNIEYQWIKATDVNPENRILVILTDITEERFMENLIHLDEQRNQLIIRIVSDRDGFLIVIKHILNLINEIESNINQPSEAIDLEKLFRDYHTIKGGSMSYNLTDVADLASKVEQDLSIIRNQNKGIPADKLPEIRIQTSDLKKALIDTTDRLSEFIPKALMELDINDFYKISEKKLAILELVLKSQGSMSEELIGAIRNLRRQPIRNFLKRTSTVAKELAQKLGKQVEIEFKGENVEIIHKPYDRLFASFIHLVRNSVDHGIELPRERKNCGKSTTGKITINVSLQDQQLLFMFADDGHGINRETVVQKALQQNIITREKIENYGDDDILRLIMAPGFSTVEKVTDISGRGVGMDSVLNAVDELGGFITIASQDNLGTVFKISVPEI